MFKPCLELPPIDNAKWECTQYNLLYSQCKIKCNSGFKFIGDANARKICELYEDTKASDTKARFQIAITVQFTSPAMCADSWLFFSTYLDLKIKTFSFFGYKDH